jgi:hypothetical protein
VSLSARAFADVGISGHYLNLLGDLFVIIGARYGFAGHNALDRGNDFDRIMRNPAEPTFLAWANLFGPDLVADFGLERALSAPAHKVRELSNGGVLLTMAANPMEELDPEVQARIAAAKAHLGILSPSERASPDEVRAFAERSAQRQVEMKGRVEQAFREAQEKLAAEMQRQAEGCVAGARQFMGVEMDYGPASLGSVSRLLATHFGPAEEEETKAGAVQAFGAYAGEVVRRSLGGVWHDEEMRGQPVLLKVGPAQQRADPFAAVRGCVVHGGAQGFRLEEWYAALKALIGQD